MLRLLFALLIAALRTCPLICDVNHLAAVGTDGVVRFVDVVEGKVCCCIEPATQRQACTKMAVDRQGNYAALITREGEVLF